MYRCCKVQSNEKVELAIEIKDIFRFNSDLFVFTGLSGRFMVTALPTFYQ